ncbi:chorismate--pyruvate lyase family protein [Thiomicrorhabdus sediminis]|uniref:Probable chorismate pyruvate-lyase n=1 Tax=Thiomicrorhabdus sediminis TaxID=2580412 RepID=A0A4P9K7J5_9GAMM|nr:chorismate lyase [Thiomicrorhabdus sediminis]QCU91029.1 chorismate lyase [Thiomicrorhabdus sediminis]
MTNTRIAKIKALLKQKAQHISHAKSAFWKPASLLQRLQPTPEIADWLKTKQSLTARIRQLCPNMKVIVLSEKMERPLLDEAKALGLPFDDNAWVRCVLLQCNQHSWVYARTVIPNLDMDNPWHQLQHLGDKPLGEVLFEQSNIERSNFEFCSQPISEWPYLAENVNYPNLQWRSFGRRSLFTKQQNPLLLTEVFLPALFEKQK